MTPSTARRIKSGSNSCTGFSLPLCFQLLGTAPSTPFLFGYAPYVVGRCGSSKGLPLRKSNFVLRPPGTPSPHDITTTSRIGWLSRQTLSRCARLSIKSLFPSSRGHRLTAFFSSIISCTLTVGSHARLHILAAAPNPSFAQLNLHNTRVRRKPGGHPQTALPNARRAIGTL
jgi:hypothetical protein